VKVKRKLLIFTVILFLIGSFLVVHKVKWGFLKGTDEQKDVGRVAPDFALNDLNGKSVKLTDLKGKTVILNFFATWCPACVMEMPKFDYAREELREGNALLFLISSEPKEVLEKFIKDNGYSFCILVDENGSVSQLYGIDAIPRTIVIGEDGKIVYSKTGAIKSLYKEILPKLPKQKSNREKEKESFKRVDNILKLIKCDCNCGKSLYECKCPDCPQRKNLDEIREYIRRLVLEEAFTDEQIAQIVEWKYCKSGNSSKKDGAKVENNQR
jgi:peroxiredoxin